MNRVFLFTGIYDFFGLRLAGKLHEQGYDIYCLCSKKLEESIIAHINSLPEDNTRKKELNNIFNHIRIINYSIEDADFNITCLRELLEDKKVSLWHYNDDFSFDNSYNYEVIKLNNYILRIILKMIGKLNVDEINYISSIYLSSSCNEKESVCLGTYKKVRKLNEEFFINKLSDTNVKVKIYRTPILYKDFLSNRYKVVDEFLFRLFEFKNWVGHRIPNYFRDNSLLVYMNENNSLNLLPTDIIIDNIYENYLLECENKIEVFYITNPKEIKLKTIINKINNASHNINIKITYDKDKLNDIDILFDKIINYHLPYLKYNLSTDLYGSKLNKFKSINLYNKNMVLALKNRINYYERKKVHDIALKGQIKKTINLKDGKKLDYYSAGKGETIIIVSAYGVEVQAWDDIISELSKNYHVIVWMIRGVHNNELPENDSNAVFGIKYQIEDIQRIIENEKIDKFHFISWCSGVKSALMYTIKHSSKVKSHIILAGEFVPYEGSDNDQSKFRGNISFILDMIKHNKKMLDFYARMIYEGTFRQPVDEFSKDNGTYIYEIVPERYRDILLNPFTTREKIINFLNMCMEYYEHDITEIIQKIHIPVLLLCAEYDLVAPYEQTYWADNLFNKSNLICFPSATHLMFVERQRDIIDAIRKHMKYIN